MKSFLVQFGFVVTIFAAIFLFVGREDMGYAFSEPVDINVDFPADYNDVKAVKTDIYMVLDYFAELETTTERNGAITDRDYTYYYILPVFTEDEDTYFVGVEVDEDDDSEYDEIADLTWEYIMGEESDWGNKTVAFEGGFVEMEDELYEYFIDWFEEAEWFESEADMNKHALPLLLKPALLSRVKTMIMVSAGALVLGILMIVLGFMPSKKKAIPTPVNTTVEINGIVYPISNFENVNKLVVGGKVAQATKEVSAITGLGLEESKAVVDNWNQYWR